MEEEEEEDVDDDEEDEEDDLDCRRLVVSVSSSSAAATEPVAGGGVARRSKFARGREHWHRDQRLPQPSAKTEEQPAGTDHYLLLKEQELRAGGGREERVSQDDSGIGVGTSLEVLAGLATTPSPTFAQQGEEEEGRGFQQQQAGQGEEGGGEPPLTSGPIS